MLSKNLDQGFPGDLNSECTFEIKNKSLFIKYQYKSNQLTHVSLTNHSYWNLNKNKKETIFNHDLKVNSEKYLEVNNKLIPTGKIKKVNVKAKPKWIALAGKPLNIPMLNQKGKVEAYQS